MTIKVELFTAPSCPSCAQLARMLADTTSALASEIFDVRVVDVVEEIDYAVAKGVLSTPSIAIDERLIFASVPTRRALERALEKHLRENEVWKGVPDGKTQDRRRG